MRIVVEPGSYSLENMGDVAMLQVAARRLRALWPHAAIDVVTEAPQRLPELCPGTTPILTRELLQPDRRRHLRLEPRGVSRRLWQRLRGVKQHVGATREPPDFAATLRLADLLVVSGMGGLNDSFVPRAFRLLGTIELAEQYHVPVALLGQGVGPLQDPVFKEKVARTLSGVDLIALRERIAGPALLDQMGVSPAIVRITGDDAIELAYADRLQQSGNCLGINVRLARYASVDETIVRTVRTVLRDAAARLRTRVLPVPISHRHGGLDARTNRALLQDMDPGSDGGATLLTPQQVIRQVGRCRLVIAGSYHAGVFALAQGIPVVGLVNSRYYADKFLGLAEMFGTGCEVLSVGEPGFSETLAAAIDRGWASAPQARARLLGAAAEQIEMGREAYRGLLTLPRERTLRARQEPARVSQ